MRFLSLGVFLGASLFVRASPPETDNVDGTEPTLPTKFNNIEVPPLLELTPSTWDEEIKKSKYLFVKHYSPYCSHCKKFAPFFQTTYEYFYTSKPAGAETTTFEKFYDFRFGIVNCVAYSDMCMDHDVQSYPTTTLYEDGVALESLRGKRNMTSLFDTVEIALEKAKPGTFTKLETLPEPGDTVYPNPEASAEATATGAEKSKATGKSDTTSKKDSEKAQKSLDDATEGKAGKADKSGKTDKTGKSDGLSKKQTDKTKSSEKSSEDKMKSDLANEPKEKAAGKFGDEWKTPTTGEMLKQKTPQGPAASFNQNGASVPLSLATFDKLVTSTEEPWFIKFYAPWCSHCRALAPTWEQLAKEMKNKMNIGEVNCDVEQKLCKDVGAKGYPTLLFYKGTEKTEYRGLRGLGDLSEYAEKARAVAGGIPDVNAAEFKELEAKEDVIFVYFYDHATTSEDFKALDQIPLHLIGRAKIVKTNDADLYSRFKITTWPRLLVSREGRPTYYTPITPDEMRDVEALAEWMKSVWLPLVPEMTSTNARQIMEHKIVALAILNRQDEANYKKSIDEIKNAANEWMDRQVQKFQDERKKLRDAKQQHIEDAQKHDDQRALRNAKAIKIDMDSATRKEVGFAWVDGVFWQRWLENTYNINVRDGERLVINEEDRRRFWDSDASGNHIMISKASVLESLDNVVYGPNNLKPKSTLSPFWKVFFDLKISFIDRPYFSASFVVLALAIVAAYVRRVRRARPTLFRLDDGLGLKDGLLGQNNNAKSD